MKRTFLLLNVSILLLLTYAGLAAARITSYSLPWWTMDSGGGDSSNASYKLRGSIGQPDAGLLANSNYKLSGGFWSLGISNTSFVYLPMILKYYSPAEVTISVTHYQDSNLQADGQLQLWNAQSTILTGDTTSIDRELVIGPIQLQYLGK